MKHLLLILSLLVVNSLGEIDQSDVYWLEHAIDANDFKELGSLNLKQVKQNQYAAQFQSYQASESTIDHSHSSTQFSTQLDSINDFDQQMRNEIKNAYKANNNSFYRLRLVKKQPFSVVASSFTYLKYLIEANFNINLTLTTGYTGRLNSMSIKTQPSKTSATNSELNVFASLQNIKPGQAPETEVYLEKLRKEQEQKEKGAQGENQSFFSKYWIYIVPFVVIMFISNLANPEGAAGGGR